MRQWVWTHRLQCFLIRDVRCLIILNSFFAQVTNPPIDAIREEIVTCTTVYAGKQGNLLEEKRRKLPGIKDQQSDPDKYRYVEDQKMKKEGFRVAVVPITYYKKHEAGESSGAPVRGS